MPNKILTTSCRGAKPSSSYQKSTLQVAAHIATLENETEIFFCAHTLNFTVAKTMFHQGSPIKITMSDKSSEKINILINPLFI